MMCHIETKIHNVNIISPLVYIRYKVDMPILRELHVDDWKRPWALYIDEIQDGGISSCLDDILKGQSFDMDHKIITDPALPTEQQIVYSTTVLQEVLAKSQGCTARENIRSALELNTAIDPVVYFTIKEQFDTKEAEMHPSIVCVWDRRIYFVKSNDVTKQNTTVVIRTDPVDIIRIREVIQGAIKIGNS